MAKPVHSTVPGSVVNPFLSDLQEKRTEAFNATQQFIHECIPGWEAQATQLDQLFRDLKQRAHNLQGQYVMCPSETQLVAERETFLGQYWGYQRTSTEIGEAGDYIQSTIVFLTPKLRAPAETRTLESSDPDQFAQIRKNDECCQNMIGALRKTFSNTATLRDRMVTLFKDNVNYQMDRFCQLVANKGAPLPVTTRGVTGLLSYVVDYTIPKCLPKPTKAPGEATLQSGGPSASSAAAQDSPPASSQVPSGGEAAAKSSAAPEGNAAPAASSVAGQDSPPASSQVPSGGRDLSSGQPQVAAMPHVDVPVLSTLSLSTPLSGDKPSKLPQASPSQPSGPSWSEVVQTPRSATATVMTSGAAGHVSSSASGVQEPQNEAAAASSNSSGQPQEVHQSMSTFLAPSSAPAMSRGTASRESSPVFPRTSASGAVSTTQSRSMPPPPPQDSQENEAQQARTATATSSSSSGATPAATSGARRRTSANTAKQAAKSEF